MSEIFIPELFIPGVVAGHYGLLLVELQRCSVCGRQMLHRDAKRAQKIFPLYLALTLKAQLNRANWRLASGITDKNNDVICESCAAENLGSFVCVLCGIERPSEAVQQSIGDPPDYLCKICYDSVTARAWERKIDELEKDHRYDYSS
jgi:hypothetical protein